MPPHASLLSAWGHPAVWLARHYLGGTAKTVFDRVSSRFAP
ncbi:hypothetical protein [Streptomyces albicerus]|nr:hypothetical protein [Streptomyces albicerus]